MSQKISLLQRISKNYFFLVISHLTTGIIGLLSTVYIAQILGVANFGKISFAFAFITYFTILANPGLDRLGMRLIAQDKNSMEEVGSLLVLRFFLAIISLVLLFVIVRCFIRSEETGMIIYIYGISIFLNVFLFDWVFQGLEKMEFIAISRIVSKLVYLILILVFIKHENKSLLVPVFFDITMTLSIVFLFVIYTEKHGTIRFRLDIGKFLYFLKTALPFALVFIVTQIYFNFDVTLLWFLKNDDAVGIYQAAYRIIYLLLPFFNFFFLSLFPGLSNMNKKNPEKIQPLLTILLRFQFIVTLPLVIGGTVTAKQLILLLYGEMYSESIVVLQILLWTMGIFILANVFLFVLLACEKDKKVLFGISIGTCINIIGNIFLIPQYGAIGASISSVIGSLVILIILYIQIRRVFTFKLFFPFFKPLVASVLMGIILYLLSFLNFIFLFFIGVVFYSIFVLLLKCITRSELSALKNQLLSFKRRPNG